MKLLITRNTVAQLRQVRKGDVIEVDEREARILMGGNKAEPAPADAVLTPLPAPPQPDSTQVEVAAVVAAVDAAKPAPSKPPKKAK